jgi:hypothetical protein
VGYFAVLAMLLEAQPLWLDEILQLLGTRGRSPAGVLEWAAVNPGAAPLGYLAQWSVLQVAGFTMFSARLSSALFSALSCLSMVALSRRLGLRNPAAAFLLFALLPLQFRYAHEARPYSQGLFFTIWSLVEAVKLGERPSRGAWIRYAAAVAGGLYTTPYSGLAAAAQVIWMPRLAIPAGLAGGLFLPWFLVVRSGWREQIAASGLRFAVSGKTAAMVVRESCGGGYLLAALVLGLAAAGFWLGRGPERTRRLLALSVVVPVAGALLCDAAFGYFFAIRQVLAMVPALCLLASEGLLTLSRPAARAAAAVTAAFCLYHDARPLFAEGREDWAAAARAIRETVPAGGCLALPASGEISLYAFFEPELRRRVCGDDLARRDAVVAAASPYTTADQRRLFHRRLCSYGFGQAEVRVAGGTEISLFLNCCPEGTLWGNRTGGRDPGPEGPGQGMATAEMRHRLEGRCAAGRTAGLTSVVRPLAEAGAATHLPGWREGILKRSKGTSLVPSLGAD